MFDADALLVASGDQRGARRTALRSIGVCVREPYAPAGQPVDVRRPCVRRTVTAEVSIPDVVHQNKNNVRSPGGGSGDRLRDRQTNRRDGEETDYQRYSADGGGPSRWRKAETQRGTHRGNLRELFVRRSGVLLLRRAGDMDCFRVRQTRPTESVIVRRRTRESSPRRCLEFAMERTRSRATGGPPYEKGRFCGLGV